MSRKRRGGDVAGSELEELLDAVPAAGADDDKCQAFARAFDRGRLG